MCISPGHLADGTEFPCHKCWQCHENKVNDWVGRCLAESKTAKASFSITLTYGRDDDGESDHLRAAWLTYSDVQKFFKLLRFDGYKFRYLVAGEYGSMKGRAHWHLLMFFSDRVPPHELSTVVATRFTNKYWPHGWQHWEAPSPASIRYVCKYIQKDIGKDERQGHLSMSKKPPLGDAYFRSLALQYVENGLAPQDLAYKFPEVKDRQGNIQTFYMSRATAHNFIEAYKSLWSLHHPGKHHPVSVLIDEHDDKVAKDSYFLGPQGYQPRIQPPYRGSGPFLGRDPDTGRGGLYSDDDLGRLWYRSNEEGHAWVREGTTEMPVTTVMVDASPIIDAKKNAYLRVKEGLDIPISRARRHR